MINSAIAQRILLREPEIKRKFLEKYDRFPTRPIPMRKTFNRNGKTFYKNENNKKGTFKRRENNVRSVNRLIDTIQKWILLQRKEKINTSKMKIKKKMRKILE